MDMRRRLDLLLAGLAAGLPLFAQPAAPPAPPPLRRAVLVSFDGAGGLDLARRLPTLSPNGFRRALRDGFSAHRLIEVTPSQTSVSHASISAGAPPDRTGIVGNTFHPARAPLAVRERGFDATSEVEMVWEAGSRQGKRVASLGWPGITQKSPRTSVPVALTYTDSIHGLVIRAPTPALQLADLLFALPRGNPSFSPPKALAVRLPEPETAPLTCALIDSTDDGRRNYDELLVVSPSGEVRARARAGEWFSLAERRGEDQGDRDVLVGRWLKVLSLAPDLSSVVLYVGPSGRNHAFPEDFRRTLDKRAGFWPGPPDWVLITGPDPDLASYLEQSARFSRFFVDAFQVAQRRGDWDLLLAYQPLIDEAEHYLMPGPEEPPERRDASQASLADVWKIADAAAASYLKFAGEGDVFLVSDHGMRHVTRALWLQELLRRKGFIKTERRAGRLATAPDSPADAVHAGGGTSFIVVNRSDRLENGVVPEQKADALVKEIASALSSFHDEEGKPVFDLVTTPRDARALGLDHANAGDLIVIGAGATVMKNGFPAGGDSIPLLEPAGNPGEHGFGPDPELDGILFHVGDGVTPGRVPSFRSVDVAARVCERLRIAPPGALR
jgi:hypothetical protein